jgi:hypothetical protein
MFGMTTLVPMGRVLRFVEYLLFSKHIEKVFILFILDQRL